MECGGCAHCAKSALNTHTVEEKMDGGSSLLSSLMTISTQVL